MSFNFVAGSSHYIYQNSAFDLSTNQPWSCGFWFWYPSTPASNQDVVTIAAGAAQRVWEITINTSAQLEVGYFNGSINGYSGPAIGNSRWCYVLVRRIANNNRRTHILDSTAGAVTSEQSTINFTAGAIDRITIGALYYNSGSPAGFVTGKVAEFFVAQGDVGLQTGVIETGLLRALAYRGPLSIPHIAPMVVEYLPLRGGNIMEGCYQRGGNRPWTIGALPGPWSDPPMQPDYVRPNQNKRLLAV